MGLIAVDCTGTAGIPVEAVGAIAVNSAKAPLVGLPCLHTAHSLGGVYRNNSEGLGPVRMYYHEAIWLSLVWVGNIYYSCHI